MDKNEKLKKDIARAEANVEGLLVNIQSARLSGVGMVKYRNRLRQEMATLGDKEFELEMRLQLVGERLFHGQ